MTIKEKNQSVLTHFNYRLIDLFFALLSMIFIVYLFNFHLHFFVDINPETIRILIYVIISIQLLFTIFYLEISKTIFDKNSNLIIYKSRKLFTKKNSQFFIKDVKKIFYKRSVPDIFSNPGKVKPKEKICLIFNDGKEFEIARCWFFSTLSSDAKKIADFLNLELENKKPNTFEIIKEDLFKK